RGLGRGDHRDQDQRGEQEGASGDHETGSSGVAAVRGIAASANGTRPGAGRQPGSESGANPCRYTSGPDGSEVNSASRSASEMSGTPSPPTGDGPVPPASFGATKTWNSSAAWASRNEPRTPAPPSTRTLVIRRRPSSASTASTDNAVSL